MGFWKLIWFDLKVRSVDNNMPNCPELVEVVHTRFCLGHLCAKLQTILYRSTSFYYNVTFGVHRKRLCNK